jgi:transposase
MIALLRYGSGFPWHRLESLEENLGIRLPVATQCEIVQETATKIQPALDELMRQAAQGNVVHNDDTSMRVLSLDRDAVSDPGARTGHGPARAPRLQPGPQGPGNGNTVRLLQRPV